MTCDKNADLAPFVNASYDRLYPGLDEALIVTESDAVPYWKRNVFCAHSTDFATKLRSGLRMMACEDVLVLLDDHFILDIEAAAKIRRASKDLKANGAACISLAKSEKSFVKYKAGATPTARVFADLQKYQIDFHPTLWKKDVLLRLLGDATMSAWEIEPLFHGFIRENNLVALYSSNHLKFAELVYRGTFIRAPFSKYGSPMYRGSRPVQGKMAWARFRIRMWVYHHTPYWLKKMAK